MNRIELAANRLCCLLSISIIIARCGVELVTNMSATGDAAVRRSADTRKRRETGAGGGILTMN